MSVFVRDSHMSFTKAQDIIRLAMLATEQEGITLEEITEIFSCSHRTAQRMTRALEVIFPQVQSMQGNDRRTRWLMPTCAIRPLLTASSDELIALSQAVTMLERAGMKKEAALAQNLERKITTLIPVNQRIRLDVDKEAVLEVLGFAARPGPRPIASGNIIEAIYEALKAPRLLHIVYRSYKDGNPRERTVAPYGLLLGTRRYLVGRDVEKGKKSRIQHFRVEEIYKAELINCPFEVDPDFDLNEYAKRGFGSFVNDAEFGEVIWRFIPEAAEHARRYVFHPNQIVKKTKDGSLIVKFESSGYLEMAWHLYSWGNSVEVIAPVALREMVSGYQRSFPALP